jgi:hypothetical protein
MKATPETIWQVPVYLPYLQPPLTDEAVASAEQKLGFRLPATYLAVLRVQNGGYIRYTLPDSVHRAISGIGPQFPSLTDFDWDHCRDDVSYALDGLIPFDGDGHWHLCLDYRRNSAHPAVTYADVECDEESEVAPTFAEYLALLRVEVGELDFVMPNLSDLEEAKRALANKLEIQFEPPDSRAHGYPEHRATRRADGKSEWIWISPNLVPRGFVRSSDKRFEELRRLMPGDALRFPELSKSSVLLTMTDGIRSDVLRACEELGIDVRPLSEYFTEQ